MKPISMLRWLGACAALLLALGAQAQDWPTRPIRMIVPGAAGASADALARTMGDLLAKQFGVPVVVENRVGGSGIIGADAVAKAAPDGYTLLFGQQDSQTILPLLKKSMPYDTFKDFMPIAKVGDLYLVYATHAAKAQDMRQFIALARENPGKMNYASGGAGGINQLVSELLLQRAGVQMQHIPYKGGAPAATALMAGEVDLFGGSYALLGRNIESGRLRGLAVTGTSRLQQLPNVPTMVELGYKDFVVSAWYGVLAPAGLPEPVAAKLASAILAAANTPEYKARLQATGAEGTPLDRAGFTRFLREDYERWRDVIQKGKITLPD